MTQELINALRKISYTLTDIRQADSLNEAVFGAGEAHQLVQDLIVQANAGHFEGTRPSSLVSDSFGAPSHTTP